jgi:carbamoyl-phosphate synthase large subunit
MTGKVLVTGVAGDVGQGVALALSRSRYRDAVLGADADAGSIPRALVGRSLPLPLARSDDYLPALTAVIEREGVGCIIPGSEAETSALLEAGWLTGSAPCAIIAPNADAVRICLDKLTTSTFLREHGIAVPWTVPATSAIVPEFPCIRKRRRGRGSRGLQLIAGPDEVPALDAEDHVFQQYLSDDGAEFTCGLYRDGTGGVRTIVLRRRLSGGRTGTAVVERHGAIEVALARVAEALDLRGSVNVQLRLVDDRPMIFEINPRYSSTVAFRDEVGFRDVVWAVDEANGFPIGPYLADNVGRRYRRGDVVPVVAPPS